MQSLIQLGSDEIFIPVDLAVKLDAPYLALRGGAGAPTRINTCAARQSAAPFGQKPHTETPIKYLGQIELALVFSDPGF